MKPSDHLESVKNLLLTDFRIKAYQIVREFEETQKCYIRARLTLSDGSFLEFSEYIEKGLENEIQITDYSYHWIDNDGRMLRRWDNTKHFPKLKNFPHHVHIGENEVASGAPINIFMILDEIAKIIGE
jgi:hypothetical protein